MLARTFCSLMLVICQPLAAFEIIAHRGASGYLPEHTLAAAVLAHGQSPDFIEQDLVLSKDGVLIVLHDIHLETVTDVETVFPSRARDDGRWYVIDFTLAELKQLTVHERQNAKQLPVFPKRFRGKTAFSIATFEEQVVTLLDLNRTTGKQIGFYPEIKSPAFHRAQGQDISAIFVAMLRRFGLDSAEANIIVQCFDFNEVKRLRTDLKLQTRLVQLIGENSWNESTTDYQWLRSNDGLRQIAQYANGIGPWINQVLQLDNAETSLSPQDWVANANQLGLTMHPYTYRSDALPQGISGDKLLNALINAGADGIFTDQVPPVVAFVVGFNKAE